MRCHFEGIFTLRIATRIDQKQLIETKIQKDIDKVIYDWPEDKIKVEKARWGRFNIISGKIKIELPKTFDIEKLTLEDAKEKIAKLSKKKSKSKK